MATVTPNYGWDVPTSTDYVKDGATAIETLGDDIDASLFSITGGKNVGYQHLSTTTATTASTISINTVFNSTYANYVVTYSLTGSTSSTPLNWRMRVSGADNSSASYFQSGSYATVAGTLAVLTTSAGTQFRIGAVESGSVGTGNINVFNPFDSGLKTHMHHSSIMQNGVQTEYIGDLFNLTTSFDGFTIYPTSGTVTGTVRIYGLRNS